MVIIEFVKHISYCGCEFSVLHTKTYQQPTIGQSGAEVFPMPIYVLGRGKIGKLKFTEKACVIF